MTTTANPIFTQTPFVGALSLAAVTACTTRAPTATASLAAANILQLTPTSVNGRRIDTITVQACASAIAAATTAGLIQIWMWDGTNAYLFDEIAVQAVTPSATTPAFSLTRTYSTPINLPAAYKLYASSTVTTTASTNALEVIANGGDY